MPARLLDLSRAHDEPLATALPPLVLDRHRIVHSAAFRRLLRKTQVFVAVEDDHFRTRLTHTLEVAHLARWLASALELEPDLAEAVALAHDLGHPPFGHAGEQALDACLRDHGGFEHNRHTLRIVEELEHPYPQFPGLNLTRAVRECLAKHRTAYDRPGAHPLQDDNPPPPEGRVVDLADRLAYGLHDLQDGLYAGLIDPEHLETLALWRLGAGEGWGPPSRWRAHLRPVMDRVQQEVLNAVVRHARERGETVPSLPDWVSEALAELEAFLLKTLYRSPRLVRADAKARRVVRAIFEAYVAEPRLMPPRYARRVGDQPVERVVADYVAGMTDRYCVREYARLFDPSAEA